jgi:hypothetical protein
METKKGRGARSAEVAREEIRKCAGIGTSASTWL